MFWRFFVVFGILPHKDWYLGTWDFSVFFLWVFRGCWKVGIQTGFCSDGHTLYIPCLSPKGLTFFGKDMLENGWFFLGACTKLDLIYEYKTRTVLSNDFDDYSSQKLWKIPILICFSRPIETWHPTFGSMEKHDDLRKKVKWNQWREARPRQGGNGSALGFRESFQSSWSLKVFWRQQPKIQLENDPCRWNASKLPLTTTDRLIA